MLFWFLLASLESEYMNGEFLRVDGGFTLTPSLNLYEPPKRQWRRTLNRVVLIQRLFRHFPTSRTFQMYFSDFSDYLDSLLILVHKAIAWKNWTLRGELIYNFRTNSRHRTCKRFVVIRKSHYKTRWVGWKLAWNHARVELMGTSLEAMGWCKPIGHPKLHYEVPIIVDKEKHLVI